MQLLTLAEIREQLWANGLPADSGPSDYNDATDAQIATWNLRLNRVIQRFMEQITPARTYRRIDVPIYDGQFTLPRDCRSVLQVTLLDENDLPCSPLFIYSRFHQFAQCCSGTQHGACLVAPICENAQTFRVPEAPFRLRVTSTQQNGQYQMIGGYDSDEEELFTTEAINITNGSATGTTVYSRLPRIQKPITNVSCEVYSVDNDNVATLIAIHAPGETNPAYQRYSAPQWREEAAARVLTRLCYVKLTADSDIVTPSSYGAISRGLMALRYEDAGDDDRAQLAWAQAIELIDSDKQMLEGEAEVPTLNVMPEYAAAGTHAWLM